MSEIDWKALCDAGAAEVVKLRAERDEALHVANEALTAIDEVESEPGAGTIFKIDWTRGLKFIRDNPGNMVAQLRADRDAAHMKLDGLEAEVADFRAAWAILDEPGEKLRGAHTAADVAQRFVAKLAEARAAADTNGASLDACEARARVLLEDNERLKALLDIQKQATAGAQNICVSEQGDRELAEHVARAVVAERDEARATAELHRVALAAAQADAAKWFDERGVYMLSRAQAARELRALAQVHPPGQAAEKATVGASGLSSDALPAAPEGAAPVCATCGDDGFVTRSPGDEFATEHVPCPDCARGGR